MESYKYLIIGGGIAGERAAEGIRKVDTEGSIAILTAEARPPYERPPLSKAYMSGREGLETVYLRNANFFEQNQVRVFENARATSIDRAAHQVTLEDGRVFHYQKLLLATGGTPNHLNLPGSHLNGLAVLRTIDDAAAIRLTAQPGKRVVVIGGSFIGAEVAASLAQAGARVTIVFPEDILLKKVAPPELGAFLRDKYEAHDVGLLPGRRPAYFEGGIHVQRVGLDDGAELETDLVVLGLGIRLATDLARHAGLTMGVRGAVVVDEQLRTNDPDIYAAGDIAEWPDPTFGKRLRVEHWDVARQQGLRAGRNMAGEDKPYTALPYFYSDIFDLNIEAWGDLSQWDQALLRGPLTMDAGRFTLYYFSAGRMTGALTVGQITGPSTGHEVSGGLPEEEKKELVALIKSRPAYEEFAATVQVRVEQRPETAG